MSAATDGRRPRTASALPRAETSWIAGRVLRPVTVAFAVVAIGCAVLDVAGTRVPMAAQLIPFAVSILVFGLPHGALDHLVIARLDRRAGRTRSIVIAVAVYGVVGAATFALWCVAPAAGFAAFIAIIWFHWGQGDLWVDRLLGDGATGRGGSVVTVAARGALPMILPLATQPDAYAAVVDRTTALLGTGAHPSPTLHVGAAVRIAAATVVVVLLVAHLVVVHRSGATMTRQVGETVVLAAFFALVPPVLAVGLYFTLWHAVRHIVRLELLDPVAAGQLRRRELLRPFLRFARQAWPITAIAVAMLVVLGVALRRVDLGVYLILIAALTTPHTVIVAWMDRRQRTWGPPVEETRP
ncbi:Brp/Blh family beta-carotene 15,15'-dioxygenase [Curtobacterium sp. RRHDQ10]|uniref:Brp/Blh family beta-carotene 15,15'-dioxygenase n=1 Tax=Curtobacterium phyllosphaerae TaxID=3413379 RepID=UPI003BF33C95